MTPAEVRAALADADPRAALDTLIRRDLAAGAPTGRLYGEALAVYCSSDLSPDQDDALGDILDALTGWCGPACRYRDGDPTSGPHQGRTFDVATRRKESP